MDSKIRKNKLLIPTEDEECIAFVQWLRLRNIPCAHIPNESRSSSRTAMIRGAKLKRMGQSRGVWDYEVFVPVRGVTGDVDCYQLLKIEMKRQKNSKISPEQSEWGKIYEAAGIPCKVCRGAREAIDFVEQYLTNIQ